MSKIHSQKAGEVIKSPNMAGKLKSSPKHGPSTVSETSVSVPVPHPSGPRFLTINTKSLGISLAVTMVISVVLYSMWSVSDETVVEQKLDKDVPYDATSNDIIFEVGAGSFVTLNPRKPLDSKAEIRIVLDDPDIINTIESISVEPGSSRSIFIPIHSKDVAGHCTMSFKSSSSELKNLFKLRIKIKVVHNIIFGYLSIVLGWLYFLCWAFVYYPQIYSNWKRQSVIGLSFDYVSLNFTGHICYCIFNAAMYWNTYIQKEYTRLHPKGELPVHMNDNMFSLHAVFMMSIIIAQCFVFERGEQRISLPIVTLVGGFWLTIISGLFGAIMEKISWLQFLYYLAYIKIGTVPLKYTPQVYLNYQRKSTEGWSIHSVIFDFSGGMLSFLQMFVDVFNNDDWDGTLGNPGKLGLGVMGILFNMVFMFQHYVLYRPTRSSRIKIIQDKEKEIKEFSKKLEQLKANIMPIKRVNGVQEL